MNAKELKKMDPSLNWVDDEDFDDDGELNVEWYPIPEDLREIMQMIEDEEKLENG